MKWLGSFVVVWAAVMPAAPSDAARSRQSVPQPSPPAFRSGVDVVSVAAVVRDRRGRFVRNLSRGDFEVRDEGRERQIVEFRTDVSAPVSMALLFDVSGSMHAAFASARHVGDQVVSGLETGRDEAAVFTFGTMLQEVQPFTTEGLELQQALDRILPFGATSLYDAIAGVARRVVERASRRRAVVVLTDGVDTNSRLTPSEVSGIASAIDVPVYLMIVVSAVDQSAREAALASQAGIGSSDGLAQLARWTGGDAFVVSTPAHADVAARQVIEELRHQYLIAFESSGSPGWHPLEIRTKDPDLVVRARSGYIAGNRS